MTNVRRIYVEKRKEYATEAHEIQTNLVEQLGLTIHSLRIVHRYDVQGISEEILQQGINTILAEPMVDHVYDETFPMSEKESVFAIEFLPGQYDQRADSCEQCFQILTGTSSTKVRCAKLIVVDIDKNEDVLNQIKHYLINPVDQRIASLEKPEHLNDETGKMSKSKGNIVEPFTTMKKYGADTIRFYLPYVSPVWSPIKFDDDGLKEVYSKYLSTFKNAYSFFEMYANADKIDPREYNIPVAKRDLTDRWLLSKLNHMVKDVTEGYEKYDLNIVVHKIVDFINDDFSNWYIRSNRRRFWGSELNDSKKAVYKTTYEVLTGVCKLLAPIIPFITEELFIKLTGKESVHLEDYPVCDDNMINEKIEEKMDLVRDLISLGRNAREEVKIKVRQPISEIIIDGKNKDVISDLTDLIKEELNVKNVVFENDLSKYMNFTIKPNFKVCGKMFGKEINNYAKMLSTLNDEDVNKLQNGNTITHEFNGETLEITPDMVDIRIESKEGFDAAKENNNFIILNTTLTEDLINEGIVRELVSKVQNLRKVKDFDVADRITLYYDGDIESIISEFTDYIKKETLSVDIVKKEDLSENFNLNGIDVKLDVEKVTQ